MPTFGMEFSIVLQIDRSQQRIDKRSLSLYSRIMDHLACGMKACNDSGHYVDG